MLKLIFWALLAANGLLFAYQQGYLETLLPSGREPARMRNQLNADKIKLISGAVPTPPAPATHPITAASSSAAAPATSSAVAAPEKTAQAASQAGPVSCIEIGNFTGAEARRFEAHLASVAPGSKFARREIQEAGSHMVFIPPQDGKEGADRQVAELRRLDISDFYVIQDNSSQRWGISLGIFKSEEAARAHLQILMQKGIRNAQLVDYRLASNRIAFQLREPDTGNLDRIKAGFPRQEVRGCASEERKGAGAPAMGQSAGRS